MVIISVLSLFACGVHLERRLIASSALGIVTSAVENMDARLREVTGGKQDQLSQLTTNVESGSLDKCNRGVCVVFRRPVAEWTSRGVREFDGRPTW